MKESKSTKLAFATLLKDGRLRSGKTQREVSELLGYSTSQFISNWERGISSPPLQQLKRLAKIYKIEPDHIYEIMVEDARTRLEDSLHRQFYGVPRKKA